MRVTDDVDPDLTLTPLPDGARLSPLGATALLLDAAGTRFSEDTQRRIHAAARVLRGLPGFGEIVPGMNNLLVLFDGGALTPAAARAALERIWAEAVPDATPGRQVVIPVIYGGAAGEDLAPWADHCGLPVAEAVRRHAAGRYLVGAVGAMPGFPYLSGLDPALAMPRRASPRARVAAGAVIVGGAQAGVMPITAPSGWHILGVTDLRLFDPMADPPTLLAPGDEVRFEIVDILP